MMRLLRTVTIVAMLAAGVPRGGAQPVPATRSSQAALEQAEQLNQLVMKLYGEGRFQEAVAPAEQALAFREKALGLMHPDVAQSLNNLAELYRTQGAYGKTEPLVVRALDIYEKVLGPTHPLVATSLNNLAALYWAQGTYGKAEPLLVRALDIAEKALGPTHPLVATSLNNLAALYRAQGAYGKAEPLYLRALDIREKALGPMHPDVAQSMNNLALLYQDHGEYRKAEPLLVLALNIREKSLGPMHPVVATSLNNLAMLYRAQGAYGKAEPLLRRARSLLEKALGPMHPTVATSLNNLALLYQEQGTYGKAEPLLLRARILLEKAFGPMHPDVARNLSSLAALYQAQGAYGKAEPLFVRALDILETVLGPMHPDVAQSLNNLARLYQAQGVYGKAEPLHVRALDIREKTLGPMHADVAESLNNLAALYWVQGAYGKAEPLYVRALDIHEKALGPTHPDVAHSLNNLAVLYQDQGAYGKAEPLYARAPDIREKTLGPVHADVAMSLNNLAGLHWVQHAYEKAELLMSRAAEIRERQLRVEFARLSEPRKRALVTLLQGETDILVSLHADTMPGSPPALELALNTLLQRKGRILDSLIDSETRLHAHLTPRLRDQLDELTQARADLVSLLYAPAGPRGVADRAAVTTARARIDDLESALSAVSAEFRAQSEPVTVAKIQAVLPRGAALVEFVRYRRFDPQQTQPWQEERYVAYLVMPHGSPQWVALGAAVPIDTEVDAVLAAMGGKIATEIAKAALQRLDALVFAPIRARLAGVSQVILAPDGKLNLVPFEALIDSQGHYALENYLVSYVTTGRDLLRLAATLQARSSAVVVADPDYGPRPSPAVSGAVSFAPLAGARAEAMDLRPYFPTTPVLGAKATKSALAVLTGPAVLHIATHGFYARDPGRSPTHPASETPAAASVPRAPPPPVSAGTLAQRDRARGMFVDGGDARWLPPLRSDDPVDGLDRAGLAMAGANQGAGGIVTAREIAGFDWWGTQLVVLSACETGMGAVPSGDGVYGLRRALVLAGAASQVVSLWSVSDASTRQLMVDYYGELAKGTGRAEALRQAKLRLMRQPRYAHPYYWAAFIPAGDWRPLDKSVFRARRTQR
jgi:tetratricopeptide (TPR) repeat protein